MVGRSGMSKNNANEINLEYGSLAQISHVTLKRAFVVNPTLLPIKYVRLTATATHIGRNLQQQNKCDTIAPTPNNEGVQPRPPM